MCICYIFLKFYNPPKALQEDRRVEKASNDEGNNANIYKALLN